MRKHRRIEMLVMFFLMMMVPLSIGLAQKTAPIPEEEIDNDPHATGCRPPTAEEQAWMDENMIVTREVRLNQLALDRFNAFLAKKKLPPLHEDEVEIVDFGEEPVGVPANLGGEDKERTGERPLGLRDLPDVVDNSELPAFPPIRSQGSIGSCGCFSTTYYGMTHMVGLARGWDNHNGNNATKFTPKWTYNMLNGGTNSGSFPAAAMAIEMNHGCATWAEFPYVGDGSDPLNYRAWCLDSQVWRNAIGFRMNQSGYTTGASTEEGMEDLKLMLLDGYVLIICTHVTSWDQKLVQDDPADPDDDEFVGEKICRYVDGTEGPHAMTVIGYNDHIWCDVNENGTVDDGEKGALKIANSWGSGWWSDGFGWMSYDALKLISGVPGGPTEGRRPAFWSDMTYWCNAREEYSPKLLAEFTLKHAKRRQLRMQLGLSETSESEPTVTWKPEMIYDQGGSFGFDGEDYSSNPEDAPQATFYFDFSDFADESWFPGDEMRWYLCMRDSSSDGFVGDALDATLIDTLEGVNDVADNAPQSADGAIAYLYSDYTWSDNSHFVSPNGSNEPPFTTWATAAHRIVDAISKAEDGDTVWVDAATYTENAEIVISNAISLKSRHGPEATIIDGGGAFRCIRVMNSDAVVEGFTLANGESGRDFGGGIQLWHGGTVSNCIITGCSSHQSAGGVFCDWGGTVENCVITGNWALINGGGAYCGWGGTLTNCTISGNSADGVGDGVFCYYGADVRNCIIYHNDGDNHYNEGDDITYEHSCTTPLITGTGNIADDPAFIDHENGDYRLQGGSPCVNAGDNLYAAGATDLDGNPRIQYGTVDMGAFEAGGTLYVSPTGGDVYPYLSWETASTTISPAVGAAEETNTIMVADGTYSEPGQISINKLITLQSVNGPDLTVVDGQNSHRCFYIMVADAVIDGFTITNGDAGSGWGGGVVCDRLGIVRNCKIHGNASGEGGGVFFCEGGTVRDCEIYDNTATGDGGGVYCLEAGTLQSSIVSGNTSGGNGGGIFSVESNPRVENCLIIDNVAAGYGGGAYCEIDNILANCTISNNHADVGGGVVLDQSARARNCIIYFNIATTEGDNWYGTGPSSTDYMWCCTTLNPNGDPSNVTDDPAFVAAGSDYHLLVGSPCINAGSNDYAPGDEDLDGNPRIVNGIVDMGSYEFQAKKKKIKSEQYPSL